MIRPWQIRFVVIPQTADRMLQAMEGEDSSVRVEYDLPSSSLGQFGNPDVLQVATQIDQKIKKLLDATLLAATR